MKKKQPAKRPGRPKGSTNKTYMHATEIPASCPKCGSNQLIKLRGSVPIVRHLVGTLPTGKEYSKVTWTRRQCRKCGQYVSVRAYLGERIIESNNTESIISA